MLETSSTTFMRLQGRGASIHWKVSFFVLFFKKKKLSFCFFEVLIYFFVNVNCALNFYMYIFFSSRLSIKQCFTCFLASPLIHSQTRWHNLSHVLHLHSLCWVSADIFIWDMYIADIYIAVKFGSMWGQHCMVKCFPGTH